MDNDFSAKLQNLLSDPAALSKITAIASSLGTNQPPQSANQPPQSAEQSASVPALPPIAPDPRIALLSSVKPLLRQDKQGKIDSLLSALAVASMLKGFRK